MAITPPEKGFIFWPVGTGDCTTIRIDESIYLQIDLRHTEKSEDEEDAAWPVVDELVELLPKVDGKPYLSTFLLTHPDKDHCQGFAELKKRAFISQLWLSPRVFREFTDTNAELCDDATAFYDEAMRRVKLTIKSGGDPGPGDRVRIIGYDSLLERDEFNGFPKDLLSIPGTTITMIDGLELSGAFEAFVHAPFKDDSFGERNDCSVALQVRIRNGDADGTALLMGDLTYPILRRIFDRSTADKLSWNVLLAPHHCSKSAMYWADEIGEEEKFKQDIVRDIGNAASSPGYVVASSHPIPKSNKPGDNPPHALAKAEYNTIVPNDFICTHEHPKESDTHPVIFEVGNNGFKYVGATESSAPIEESLKAAGAGGAAATSAKGFG